ncbi:hypothetical protein [Clostridium perfringens]|uniref:hypothetical protein n=1 Tax=Clostridium perfringens TaxID=1502 RepID=UPI0013E37B22|nr:hypothetical protein [Clostridium perfringens]EJT6492910.1 hypothetical protein [Clostridium perfringens]MDK0866069.1 hypothetical protein [Clostridium perfringens]MDT7916433.1 hypothetical protein [Clostridium perfringens]MDT7936635.1 hypothetical protein [Clostridium perfringens]MDT7939781.1 hypothetical protein [Clostridium perfringens]
MTNLARDMELQREEILKLKKEFESELVTTTDTKKIDDLKRKLGLMDKCMKMCSFIGGLHYFIKEEKKEI